MIDKLRELETIIAPYRKLIYGVGSMLIAYIATECFGFDNAFVQGLIMAIVGGIGVYQPTNEPKG